MLFDGNMIQSLKLFSRILLGLCFTLGLPLAAGSAPAANLAYSQDLTQWQAIPMPAKHEVLGHALFEQAANYSHLKWQVFLAAGTPHASLEADFIDAAPRPAFEPTAGHTSGATAFVAVDNGWIISLNHGEFGGALYWFSADGSQNYRISEDPVIAFFTRPDGLYAIEGLAHMTLSRGSVLKLTREAPEGQWHGEVATPLPAAPAALAVQRDGTWLIVLSDSLVAIGADHRVHTLLAHAPWGALYPASAVLAADERRLYIGMRQFVAEVDLTAHTLRLLIPSEKFLNRLTPEDAERTRQYVQRP
jgi:hypothetical protein